MHRCTVGAVLTFWSFDTAPTVIGAMSEMATPHRTAGHPNCEHFVHWQQINTSHRRWRHSFPDWTMVKRGIWKHVWNQLWYYWINIYFNFSDFISMDANKQFAVKEYKQYAANMEIVVKNVFVKTHHFIDLIKCYYELLYRVYIIIIIEIFEINADLILQMSFKVFNDWIKPNDFILILLVFKIYPRMTDMNASSLIFIQRAIVMRKTMNEMRKIHVNRQINDVFNIQNGSNNILIHELPLNSFILIHRKNKTD